MEDPHPSPSGPHRRRPRYRGKYPRRFDEKYKERDPLRFPDTVSKVIASGKTPAGSHRPIMVGEVLEALQPAHGQHGVDCTLGYGGHAMELLKMITPGGRLIGLDVDPVELPRTIERLRQAGFGPDVFAAERSNFAGIRKVLTQSGVEQVDFVLADLGVSSMQLDDPQRGFSVKMEGPLDMRMNPGRGVPASVFLERIGPAQLQLVLTENADEPRAGELAIALAGRQWTTTRALTEAVSRAVAHLRGDDLQGTIRRVFQAIRIAVNDEFSALDNFLREVPNCLKSGGRVAILTFHSGEDRRVKKAFISGKTQGFYAAIAAEVVRPTAEERYSNPRSAPAKLRWAIRA